MVKKLAAVFSTADLARAFGWERRRAWRWVKRHKIGGQVGDGPFARWEITHAQLLLAAPDVYYALLSAGKLEVNMDLASQDVVPDDD